MVGQAAANRVVTAPSAAARANPAIATHDQAVRAVAPGRLSPVNDGDFSTAALSVSSTALFANTMNDNATSATITVRTPTTRRTRREAARTASAEATITSESAE